MHVLFESSRLIGRRAASRFASDVHARVRPLRARAYACRREPRRRLPGEAGRRARRHPLRRLGQPRPRHHRLRLHEGDRRLLRPGPADRRADRARRPASMSTACATAASRGSSSAPTTAIGSSPPRSAAVLAYRSPRSTARRPILMSPPRWSGGAISSSSWSSRAAAPRSRSPRRMMRGAHLGVIIDQRIGDTALPFFGRPALSNPIVGLLARHFECPVHGARAIRLPGGRFLMEMSPPLEFPRDDKGRVDAEATNLMVHGVVESWVREHPEQWLWLHDRWRMREGKGRAAAVGGRVAGMRQSRRPATAICLIAYSATRRPSREQSGNLGPCSPISVSRAGRRTPIRPCHGGAARRRPAAAGAGLRHGHRAAAGHRPARRRSRPRRRRRDLDRRDQVVGRGFPRRPEMAGYRLSCDRLFFATHAAVPADIFPEPTPA